MIQRQQFNRYIGELIKSNTNDNSSTKLQNLSLLFLVLFVGLTGIFVLPYFVPVNDGVSLSYSVGFSNSAAILLILLFSLGFGLWSKGLELRLPKQTSLESGSHSRVRLIAAVASLGACLAIWFLSHFLLPMGEALYFIDRLELYQAGQKVYSQFGFDYGPLMFYLPVGLSGITHLSIGDSHYLAWTLQWVAGTWTLSKVVQMASCGTKHQNLIFLLLWSFWASALVDSSPSYTPLRFCLSLALALWLQRQYANGSSVLKSFLIAAAGLIVIFFYSPEQGVAFAIGSLLFFLFCVRRRRPGTFLGITFLFATTAVCLLIASHLHLFASMQTFGGGSLNFPILPSPHSIILLLFYIGAGCVVIAAFRTRESQHALLYLICLSIATLPAALSRADLGHMIINTLGALLAVMVVASQYQRAWNYVWLAFAFVVSVAWFVHMTAFRPYLREEAEVATVQVHSREIALALTRFLGLLEGKSAAGAHLASLQATKDDLSNPKSRHLPLNVQLFAPMGVRRRMSGFPDNRQINSGYHAALFPLVNSLLQDKIAELKSHSGELLVLPSDMNCGDDTDNSRQYLRKLLLAPYVPPSRHHLPTAQPLCDFLFSRYKQTDYVSPVPNYKIWAPK